MARFLEASHTTTPHNNGRHIFAAVDRFDGHQNAELRRERDHEARSNRARLSPAN